MTTDIKKLEANAVFAEQHEQDYMLELAGCEDQEQDITAKLAKRLATGAPEAKIGELAAERDRLQRRIVSLQQDLAAASEGARTARRAAMEAKFAEQTRALNDKLLDAGRGIVEAGRELAAAWEEFDALSRECSDLKRGLTDHARRYGLNGDAPQAPALPHAEFPFPLRVFYLARQAPKAMEELEIARVRIANPAPTPPLPGLPFFVAGDSKRARLDRARVEQGEGSERPTRVQRMFTGRGTTD